MTTAVTQTNEGIYRRLCGCTWLFHAMRGNRAFQGAGNWVHLFYILLNDYKLQRSWVEMGTRQRLTEKRPSWNVGLCGIFSLKRLVCVCSDLNALQNQREKTTKTHLHAFPCDKMETFPFDLFRAKQSIEAHFIKAVCAKFKNNHGWFAYQSQTLYILSTRTDKSWSIWDLLSVITEASS